MSLEALKRWRIVVPGAILLVYLVPLFLPVILTRAEANTLLSSASLFGGIAYLLIATILGTVYYSTRARDLLWKGWVRKAQSNIKDKMLTAFQHDPPIREASPQLRQGKALIHVLYNFLDRDTSLQQKVKNVYLNGLVASSLIDAQILSTFFVVVYLIAFLVFGVPLHLIAAVAAWLILVLASALLVPVTKRHIELGDDQIDYIMVHYRNELRVKLSDLASVS
jgi:hypothetical protein